MKALIPAMVLISALSQSGEARLFAQEPPEATRVRELADHLRTLPEQADRVKAAEWELAQVDRRLAQVQNDFATFDEWAPPGMGAKGLTIKRGPGDAAGRVLIVRSAEADPGTQANLEEDLAVMSRVFGKVIEEKAGDDGEQSAMGIKVFFAPNLNPDQSLYLEGYGALFTLRVGFPLLPPPAAKDEAKEKPVTDSSWDEAKREVYGSPGEVKSDAGVKYDGDKVEKLKDALLEAFKSAANIRNLKPEDTVSLCVLGGPGQSFYRMMGATREKTLSVTNSTSRGGVLTIRVKKSDVDAFARGKLDLDQFRKKASIAIYPGSASPSARMF